jgi:hypothetical protein
MSRYYGDMEIEYPSDYSPTEFDFGTGGIRIDGRRYELGEEGPILDYGVCDEDDEDGDGHSW